MARKQFDQEGGEMVQRLQQVTAHEIQGYEDIAKEEMRKVIYSFCQKRIDFILKNELFRQFLEDDIRGMIKKNELSPSQKLGVYKFIVTANNQASKGIFDGIKPAANTSYNILDDLTSEEDADMLSQGMTPGNMAILDKIIHISNKKGGSSEDSQ